MIQLLVILIFIILICFAGVLLFGAPYLPTLAPQVESALKLADLKPGQTILELGCGDGRVLIAAAQSGINSIGYELNPLLAFIAWLRTRRYGARVKVVWGNFWQAEWPATDGIFVFLLDRYMKRLDKRCIQYNNKPLKLVSFAFKVPNRKPDKVANGVYLYVYR
ncbi:MAG TPA: hypothetical protein VFN31_01875 [Candidatus Saccharimonadales bacterium]|nr:hypothetical protein [Candidatus Saccharimonadales bacterium]